mmetsp:Transcript_10216/g.22477  ORF Transcript_10216/g.22477 Transcript_10216/m.22477 type:complete len:231 (-) Transcript_10216:143-835(-)
MTRTPLCSNSGPPMMFASGMRTSSNTNSQVFDPLIPTLSSFWAVEKPLVPFSTMKAVMASLPSSLRVLAYSTNTSASGPFVHHILFPLTTNSFLAASYSARVFMDTTSEPLLGSLIESAPTYSPLQSLGNYLSFCSTVANLSNWPMQRLVCAMYDKPIAGEMREISSTATEWSRWPRPSPPNFSSTVTPRMPASSPSLRHSGYGNKLSLSTCCAMGLISASTNDRMCSLN